MRALVAQARRARPRRAERVAAAAADARRSTSSSTRSSARALEAALEQARERGLVTGALTPGDLLRLPQALTIRERPADDGRGRRAGAGGAGARRPIDAGADRPRHDADRAKATTCAPTSTSADAGVADLVERIAAAADEGRAAMEQRLTERVARAAQRAAGRRDGGRAGDRPDRGAVGHQRRGRRGSAATSRTGRRSPTAPSRAAASSISCCRR